MPPPPWQGSGKRVPKRGRGGVCSLPQCGPFSAPGRPSSLSQAPPASFHAEGPHPEGPFSQILCSWGEAPASRESELRAGISERKPAGAGKADFLKPCPFCSLSGCPRAKKSGIRIAQSKEDKEDQEPIRYACGVGREERTSVTPRSDLEPAPRLATKCTVGTAGGVSRDSPPS